MTRVVIGRYALPSPPVRARKLRRCDGHMVERHNIHPGDIAYWYAIPPGSELGNERWWRMVFCKECIPQERVDWEANALLPPYDPETDVNVDNPGRMEQLEKAVAAVRGLIPTENPELLEAGYMIDAAEVLAALDGQGL